MPQHVTSAPSLSTFRSRLKTHLFSRCYPAVKPEKRFLHSGRSCYCYCYVVKLEILKMLPIWMASCTREPENYRRQTCGRLVAQIWILVITRSGERCAAAIRKKDARCQRTDAVADWNMSHGLQQQSVTLTKLAMNGDNVCELASVSGSRRTFWAIDLTFGLFSS